MGPFIDGNERIWPIGHHTRWGIKNIKPKKPRLLPHVTRRLDTALRTSMRRHARRPTTVHI